MVRTHAVRSLLLALALAAGPGCGGSPTAFELGEVPAARKQASMTSRETGRSENWRTVRRRRNSA